MTTVGLITIGQSPRTDTTPEIRSHLPSSVDIVESGALDGYAGRDEVLAGLAPTADEPVYVTKLRDGTSVTISKAAVLDLVGDRIDEVQSSVDAIGLLCTGSFPQYDATVPVFAPSELLHAWVTALGFDAVGVLMPKPEQAGQTDDKWGEFEIYHEAASPYDADADLAAAARSLGGRVEVIVMDCIGYTEAMKQEVRTASDTPVLLGRSVLARTLAEVV